MGVHWRDWCWSWNSSILATWFKKVTQLKRSWCWERMKAGGEGDDRGWDGWMAPLTMEMCLSKLQELVIDREAWHAALHGAAELDMTEWLNWTELKQWHGGKESQISHNFSQYVPGIWKCLETYTENNWTWRGKWTRGTRSVTEWCMQIGNWKPEGMMDVSVSNGYRHPSTPITSKLQVP